MLEVFLVLVQLKMEEQQESLTLMAILELSGEEVVVKIMEEVDGLVEVAMGEQGDIMEVMVGLDYLVLVVLDKAPVSYLQYRESQ